MPSRLASAALTSAPMRGEPRLSWRSSALIVAATVLTRLPTVVWRRWFNPDEASIAMGAQAMQRGGRLYVDMADRKPPIPPLLYRWTFDLGGVADPRLMRWLVALATGVATVVVANDAIRRFGRGAGWWAAALFGAGCIAFAPGDGGPANFAQIALPLAAVAIVCLRRPGWAWSLVGGALLALAVLSRQSWVFGVPAAALSAWLASRWRGVAAATAGFVPVIAAVAVFLPWHDFWFWTFASTPGFVFASADLGDVALKAVGSVALFVAFHLVQVAAAAAGWKASVRRAPDLWLWLLTGCAAAFAGFRFFGHYWLQVVPPLAMLATPVLAGAARRWWRPAAAVLAATLVASAVFLWIPETFRRTNRPEHLAAALQAVTQPTDRVFIWGSYAELAVALDRPIAGTQIHSDFVTGRSGGRNLGAETLAEATPGALDMMMADLTAAPPTLIVDTSTAPDLHYANYPMSLIPQIAQFVSAGYVKSDVIDGCTIYTRR